MASAPDLTFRSKDTPYGTLATALYVQSTLGGDYLPVLQGENSNLFYFRVYNNYARGAGIASAVNIRVTTFDNVDPGSHTAAMSAINQSWIRIYENGYGENSTPPGQYYRYTGFDTAIGGQANGYVPEFGSANSSTPQIRAGSDTNSVGFIEFATYAELPDSVGMATYAFGLSIQYEWTS